MEQETTTNKKQDARQKEENEKRSRVIAKSHFLRTPRSFATKNKTNIRLLLKINPITTKMVAPNLNTATVMDSAEVEKPTLSPKQLKRLEEQKAREEKKLAKRKEKALVKERRMAGKEVKEEMRERKMEELRLEKISNKTETPKKLEEAKRLAEEKALLEKEFLLTTTGVGGGEATTNSHVKKSVLESNRLGGFHMA
jgi:hypothetical protein